MNPTKPKLLPFNLTRALAGDPMVTREGKPATNLRKSETYPHSYECAHGTSTDWYHGDDGACIGLPESDLFMLDTKPVTLTKRIAAVKRAMRKKTWMTLREIQIELNDRLCYMEIQSVSARVRDLRKPQYGSHAIDRRPVGNGVFEYRLRKAAK